MSASLIFPSLDETQGHHKTEHNDIQHTRTQNDGIQHDNKKMRHSTLMLTVIFAESGSEVHYAECHHAECHYAECHHAECHHAEWHYAECHHAEWHYAE